MLKSSVIIFGVTLIESTGVSSNIRIPLTPFPGLLLIDAYGKKYRVTEVSALMCDFSAENGLGYSSRDPFGNAFQVKCEPVE